MYHQFFLFITRPANSEALKDLLKNHHLRDFIKEIDSSPNAWKAMQLAMLEPLFIEFADECLKVVEADDKPPQIS